MHVVRPFDRRRKEKKGGEKKRPFFPMKQFASPPSSSSTTGPKNSSIIKHAQFAFHNPSHPQNLNRWRTLPHAVCVPLPLWQLTRSAELHQRRRHVHVPRQPLRFLGSRLPRSRRKLVGNGQVCGTCDGGKWPAGPDFVVFEQAVARRGKFACFFYVGRREWQR